VCPWSFHGGSKPDRLRKWLKKMALAALEHYLPRGHTCYTFSGVKYVAERGVMNSVTMLDNSM
jgi:hypothetical protein